MPYSEKVKVLVSQLCPTLSDPVDGSQLGSPVRGILQARILELVATPFSTSFQPRDRTWPPRLQAGNLAVGLQICLQNCRQILGSYELPILYIVVYVYQFQCPGLSLPRLTLW